MASPGNGPDPRPPTATCALHGLHYDPTTQSGCVLCRRSQPDTARPFRLLIKVCVATGLVAGTTLGVMARRPAPSPDLLSDEVGPSDAGLPPGALSTIDDANVAPSPRIVSRSGSFLGRGSHVVPTDAIIAHARELRNTCNAGDAKACTELAGMCDPIAGLYQRRQLEGACDLDAITRGCELGDWRACVRVSPDSEPNRKRVKSLLEAACDDADEAACQKLAQGRDQSDPVAAAALRRRAEMLKACDGGCSDVPAWRALLPEERGRRTRMDIAKYSAECTLGTIASCWRLADAYSSEVGIAPNLELAREANGRARMLLQEECAKKSGVAKSPAAGLGPGARLLGAFERRLGACLPEAMKDLLQCDGGDFAACFRASSLHTGADQSPALLARAYRMAEAACGRGQGTGCRTAGRSYIDGDFVPADVPRAVALIDKGCTYGDAQSCYELANLLATGRDVTHDEARAEQARRRYVSLRQQDCDHGDKMACGSVSEAYRSGFGVPKNDALANQYRRRAEGR